MATAEQRQYINARKAEIEKWKNENDVTSKGKKLVNNDYVLFPREYFSGSEIFIIFGDMPIEDISELEFSMSQQTQPIFGYGSFTWDAMMTGSRFINGNFRINFKEAFYIQSVLNKLLTRKPELSNLEKSVNLTGTINELNSQIKNLSADELRTLSKAYEDRLWSKEEKIDKKNQTAWLNPFNGYDYLSNNSNWQSDYNGLLKHGFDIIISFGDKITELKKDPSKISEKGSVKTINGVHLTGYKTIYKADGEPIFEEYSFIARDMDNSLFLDGNRDIPVMVESDPISRATSSFSGVPTGSTTSSSVLTVLDF